MIPKHQRAILSRSMQNTKVAAAVLSTAPKPKDKPDDLDRPVQQRPASGSSSSCNQPALPANIGISVAGRPEVLWRAFGAQRKITLRVGRQFEGGR